MINKLTKTNCQNHAGNSRSNNKSRLPEILAVVILRLVFNMVLISPAYAMPPYTDNVLAKAGGGTIANSYYLDNKEFLSSQGVDAPGDLLTKYKNSEGLSNANISGNLNILNIQADFSDDAVQPPGPVFIKLIFRDINRRLTRESFTGYTEVETYTVIYYSTNTYDNNAGFGKYLYNMNFGSNRGCRNMS